MTKKEQEITIEQLKLAYDTLNYIAILQMGSLDYTKDFFELTKTRIRETLEQIRKLEDELN